MLQSRLGARKVLAALASSGLLLAIVFLCYSSFERQIPSSLLQAAQKALPEKIGTGEQDIIEWSKFAYVQYATTLPYLCNSVMLFERLAALGSKPDRLLLYANSFSPEQDNKAGKLLRKAREKYGAILKPIDIQRKESEDPTWAESFTKLLAFNQTDYDRVLHADSDSTVLQTMDELFLLPPAVVAMPRSYWEAQEPHIKLSSQLLLATPSKHQFERCEAAIKAAKPGEYDMEILNDLYRDSAMVLPYKIYDLFTREFRLGPNHTEYLGSDIEAVWNPDEAVKRAKFLHFSDWPLPKPWIEPAPEMWKENMPTCFGENGEKLNGNDENLCRERKLWIGFYEDFKTRRKQICGTDV